MATCVCEVSSIRHRGLRRISSLIRREMKRVLPVPGGPCTRRKSLVPSAALNALCCESSRPTPCGDPASTVAGGTARFGWKSISPRSARSALRDLRRSSADRWRLRAPRSAVISIVATPLSGTACAVPSRRSSVTLPEAIRNTSPRRNGPDSLSIRQGCSTATLSTLAPVISVTRSLERSTPW